MTTNTEAAELLHAVADLYECGALKWVPDVSHDDCASVVVALRCMSLNIESSDALKVALQSARLETQSEPLFFWQVTRGRNTRHVINLLRRAAARLERA